MLITENFYSGGLDSFIASLLNCWPAEDDFTIVANFDHPGLKHLGERIRIPYSLQVHRLFLHERFSIHARSRPTLFFFLRGLFAVGYYFLLPYYVAFFFLLMRRLRVDAVIIAAGSYPGGSTLRAAALASGMAKIRRSLFVYHNECSSPRALFMFPERLIDFLLERCISRLVTVSHNTQKTLLRRRPLARSLKKTVIYNGIEIPKKPTDYRHVTTENSPEPRLLMLGSYEPRKGHAFLLRAFSKVREIFPLAHLLIAGYGYSHEYAHVEKLVKEEKLDPAVTLLHFQSDTVSLLRNATILVVPSQHSESFGLCIAEALACGVPVVATQIGGIPEVLHNGVGGCTVALDANAFAQKIIELTMNTTLRKELSAAGMRAAAERFTAQRMATEYHTLLFP